MPRLRDVWILYRMELRGALRDRMIVVNSLLIPALLYPLMLWLVFLGLSFAVGQAESLTARVVVVGWPAAHPELRRDIEKLPRVAIESASTGADNAARIARGELDALVEFVPAEGAASALPDNFVLRVTFDKSKERSAGARDRLREAIDTYRDTWLRRAAAARGLDETAWQVFAMEGRNVASKKQRGAHLLSLLLPVLFAIMVLMGCFYPAVDTTAGERERGTWETLMAAPTSRAAIVVAKYLYVTTFGFVAGLINFTSMAVTLKPILAPLLSRAGESLDITLRPASLPVVLVGAVLLASFGAAGMMLFASFARTFKDGQAMITPFYLLSFLPMLFLQSPGVQLDFKTALIPVANVMLLVRGALLGTLSWPAVGLALAASLVFVAILVALAAFVLRFEDVVVGSYQGTLTKLLRSRLARRGTATVQSGERHD
jgi:sodium transport system permease protein